MLNQNILDDKHKRSLAKCVQDITIELNKITSKFSICMEQHNYVTNNRVDTIKKAQQTVQEILALIESFEENVSAYKKIFSDSFDKWISEYRSQNDVQGKSKDGIIDLSDTSAEENDIEIVNEIQYVQSKEFEECQNVRSHENTRTISNTEDFEIRIDNQIIESDNNHKDAENVLSAELSNEDSAQTSLDSVNNNSNIESNQSTKPYPDNDQAQNNNPEDSANGVPIKELFGTDSENSFSKTSINHKDTAKGVSIRELFGSDSEHSFSIEEKVTNNSNIENNHSNRSTKSHSNNDEAQNNDHESLLHYDEKLFMEPKVVIERLSELIISTYQRKFIQSTKSSSNDSIDRLCNLDALERIANNKRPHNLISSETETSSTDESDKPRKRPKKKPRIQISDNSDTDHVSSVSQDESDKHGKQKQQSKDKESETSSYYASSDSDNDIEEELSFDVDADENLFVTKTISNIEESAKFALLNDSDSSLNSENNDDDDFNKSKRLKLRRKRIIDSNSSSEENEDRRSKPDWRNDDLLRFNLSGEKNKEKANIENSRKDSKAESDGNRSVTTDKKSKVRKRTISVSSSSEEEENSPIFYENDRTTNNDEVSKKSGSKVGRRNIRPVMTDEEIDGNTRKAGKDEKNRLKRLSEREKQFEEIFRAEARNDDSLILDFDVSSKKELISIDKGLVQFLKPHQKQGVKFMWDSCFESLDLARNSNGSGCILAHCMGLGKTFQVVTLIHTLLVNKNIGVNTAVVICPKNTVLNWIDEFDLWLKKVDNKTEIPVLELTQISQTSERIKYLKSWHERGGVLVISYELFRSFTTSGKNMRPVHLSKMKQLLINPGADLVVCDEGHLLKSETSLLAEKMQEVRTLRRIILTGTPLQNNLDEYHCMLQFVKPHLLGEKNEFSNRFCNPIRNGQYGNSTNEDVTIMKKRAHILHAMLEGCVQRCDYKVLMPLLPPKQEYVILIRMSDLQIEMYQHYIANIVKKDGMNRRLFKHYNELKSLLTHPKVLYMKGQDRKTSNNNPVLPRTLRESRNNSQSHNDPKQYWWSSFFKEEQLEDLQISYKLILLFGILEKCEKKGDKLLVFSQCLFTLDLLEAFLRKMDRDSRREGTSNNMFDFQNEWKANRDYFRLDGSVSSGRRRDYCEKFNDPLNKRARLFLISTKAGGLGINLVGANRVIVFDPSWNPSIDVQSIFRVFRFGQEKPCYIYRFLAAGTIEEKIYNRQVTKLSLALRVLDEQQIERHFCDYDLTELYKFEPMTDESPMLNFPKDKLLADVIFKYKNLVCKFFEHDSLLENKEEEELDEEERRQAWTEFEQEKLKKKNTDSKKKGQSKRAGVDKNSSVQDPSMNNDNSMEIQIIN